MSLESEHTTSDDSLSLSGYRRRVHEIYAAVRSGGGDLPAWEAWRIARDELFRTHAQSALDQGAKDTFAGLHYFDHDPRFRFDAEMLPLKSEPLDIGHSGTGTTRFRAVGRVSLAALGSGRLLTVYWLDSYGGGLFIPFRDATSGSTTYGGGRYLLDTVKGADLGGHDNTLVLDFNFSYHPSCVYSSTWSCPLAPQENWVDFAICAGERLD